MLGIALIVSVASCSDGNERIVETEPASTSSTSSTTSPPTTSPVVSTTAATPPDGRVCATGQWRFQVPQDWYANKQPAGSLVANCRFLRYKLPEVERPDGFFDYGQARETPDTPIGINYSIADPANGLCGGTLEYALNDLGVLDSKPRVEGDVLVFAKPPPPGITFRILPKVDFVSGGLAVHMTGIRARDSATINTVLVANRDGTRCATIGGSNKPEFIKPPLPSDSELTAAIVFLARTFEFLA